MPVRSASMSRATFATGRVRRGFVDSVERANIHAEHAQTSDASGAATPHIGRSELAPTTAVRPAVLRSKARCSLVAYRAGKLTGQRLPHQQPPKGISQQTRRAPHSPSIRRDCRSCATQAGPTACFRGDCVHGCPCSSDATVSNSPKETPTIPDDKTITIPQDGYRVSLSDPDEIDYWCGRFGCNGTELKCAVDAVGDSASAVEAWIQRHRKSPHSKFNRDTEVLDSVIDGSIRVIHGDLTGMLHS